MNDNNMNQMNNGMNNEMNNMNNGMPQQPTPVVEPEPIPVNQEVMPMNDNVQPQPMPQPPMNEPVMPTPMPQPPVEPVQPTPMGMNNVQPQPMPMNNNVQPMGNPTPVEKEPMNQPIGQTSVQPMGQPVNNNMPQPQPVQPQPMNNGMPPQQPVYSPSPVQKKTGSNSGVIVGVALLLLIAGVVLLIIFKPFENKTSNTTNNSTNNSTNNGGFSSVTEKTYTCTNTYVENGVNIGMTFTISKNGTGAKMELKYTYAKANGQAYTTAEKDAMAKSIESNLRTSYATMGTVGTTTSTLSGGKVTINSSVNLTNYSPNSLVTEFKGEGFTCN